MDDLLLRTVEHAIAETHDHTAPLPPIGRLRDALTFIGLTYRSCRSRGKAAPTEAVLRADWFAVDATKEVSGASMRVFLRGYFERMEVAALERIEQLITLDWYATGTAKAEGPLEAETLLDLGYWYDELRKGLGPLFVPVAEEGFRSGLARAGVGGIDVTSNHPVVLASIEGSLANSKTVPATTATTLARRLNAALEDGATMAQLEAVTAQVFTAARGFQTNRIARTAVAAGFESGQIAAYDTAGVPSKAWLTERDANVREGTVYNHVIMDGVTVPVLDFFAMVTSGGLLMHPGDPSGDAGDIINCRCTTRPVI